MGGSFLGGGKRSERGGGEFRGAATEKVPEREGLRKEQQGAEEEEEEEG